MLGYARITAPFAGVIVKKLANLGDLATPGRPLYELEDPRRLRLEADVPEALVGGIVLGDEMPLRIPSIDLDLSGVVREIAPSADPNSRTFLVKLDLPDHDGLRTGLFGRVSVPVQEPSPHQGQVPQSIQHVSQSSLGSQR